MADEEELATLVILATVFISELEQASHEAEIAALTEYFATSAEKRARRKLRKRKAPAEHHTPPGERRPAGTGKRQARGRTYLLSHEGDVNYHHLTGLTAAKFDQLFQEMRPALQRGRTTVEGPRNGIARSWTEHSRLFMALHWLRHYPTLQCLSTMFGGSVSSISREIWDTVVKLYCHLAHRLSSWPDDATMPTASFARAVGAIDCTSHLRWRVHPWSCEWYRGDVHAHFITSQLICALSGRIWDVRLGLGHNNDQGMFNRTEVGDLLARRDIVLLGDGGYYDPRVITPTDAPNGVNASAWGKAHAGYRSVVEQDFSLVHFWKASGGVFRQSPELQQMVIQVIYSLVSFKYEERPLRILPDH